jgi:hypothetical protein
MRFASYSFAGIGADVSPRSAFVNGAIDDFHLTAGGPLFDLERTLHLERPGRQILAAIAVTWIPFVLFAVVGKLVTGKAEALFLDPSAHVRLLVALPLFLVAERVLNDQCQRAIRHFHDEQFVPAGQQATFAATLRRGLHARDSRVVEAILLGLAFLGGLSALAGLTGPSGFVQGIKEVSRHFSAARIWYALAAIPLYQFMLYRLLWRWAIWALVVWRMSRLPLQLVPTHPDRHGGIRFLKKPSVGFFAVLLLALSSLNSAAWGTQILTSGATLAQFQMLFGAFFVVAVALAFGPLLAFVPKLFVVRRDAHHQYGGLAVDYGRQFHRKWIRSTREDMLGSSDFQSLADLGNTYRETVDRIGLWLFGARDVLILLVAALLPVVPLALTAMPLPELLKRLAQLTLGHLPK